MKRSIRDALVGFSLVGAIVSFAGIYSWMNSVRLGSKGWHVIAKFPDASGLSERSPVTYRGIVIGTVSKIRVTNKTVLATLEIDHSELQLPLPVFATVSRGSLLGGDSQVSLISNGTLKSQHASMPFSSDCQKTKILCNGQYIPGEPASSLATVTKSLERILKDAEQKKVIEDVDELIQRLKEELARAVPIIENLSNATNHINNVVSSLDNPKTISELQATVSSAKSLTEKIDSFGSDLETLTGDPQFIDSVRKVTIGLGEFFNELYPYETRTK